MIDKAGVPDPTRMRPHVEPRPDEQLSVMVELGMRGAKDAMATTGKTGADIGGVL